MALPYHPVPFAAGEMARQRDDFEGVAIAVVRYGRVVPRLQPVGGAALAQHRPRPEVVLEGKGRLEQRNPSALPMDGA